jgi:hypothetical protein
VSVTAVASTTLPTSVALAASMVAPSAGCVRVITGAWVSRVTIRTWLVAFPAASVAVTVNTLAPSLSAMLPVNCPAPSTGNGIPLTLTVTGVRSVTVPATVTDV